MSEQFAIRSDYTPRPAPRYDDRHLDDKPGIVWQPDVYPDARRIALATGSPTIIDIGCGTGEKLLRSARGLQAIGLDHGPNLAKSAERHAGGTWRPYDIDSGEPLPVSVEELRGAVIVCADVIEHVVHPAHLIREISRALDQGATAAILSTPDRERHYGRDHLGPPPNPNHVREWTREEFARFLSMSGIEHAVMRMTRENNIRQDCRTIEGILVSTPRRLGALSVGPGITFTPPGVPIARRVSGGVLRVLYAIKDRLHGVKRRLRG